MYMYTHTQTQRRMRTELSLGHWWQIPYRHWTNGFCTQIFQAYVLDGVYTRSFRVLLSDRSKLVKKYLKKLNYWENSCKRTQRYEKLLIEIKQFWDFNFIQLQNTLIVRT